MAIGSKIASLSLAGVHSSSSLSQTLLRRPLLLLVLRHILLSPLALLRARVSGSSLLGGTLSRPAPRRRLRPRRSLYPRMVPHPLLWFHLPPLRLPTPLRSLLLPQQKPFCRCLLSLREVTLDALETPLLLSPGSPFLHLYLRLSLALVLLPGGLSVQRSAEMGRPHSKSGSIFTANFSIPISFLVLRTVQCGSFSFVSLDRRCGMNSRPGCYFLTALPPAHELAWPLSRTATLLPVSFGGTSGAVAGRLSADLSAHSFQGAGELGPPAHGHSMGTSTSGYVSPL